MWQRNTNILHEYHRFYKDNPDYNNDIDGDDCNDDDDTPNSKSNYKALGFKYCHYNQVYFCSKCMLSTDKSSIGCFGDCDCCNKLYYNDKNESQQCSICDERINICDECDFCDQCGCSQTNECAMCDKSFCCQDECLSDYFYQCKNELCRANVCKDCSVIIPELSTIWKCNL